MGQQLFSNKFCVLFQGRQDSDLALKLCRRRLAILCPTLKSRQQNFKKLLRKFENLWTTKKLIFAGHTALQKYSFCVLFLLYLIFTLLIFNPIVIWVIVNCLEKRLDLHSRHLSNYVSFTITVEDSWRQGTYA